MIADYSAFRWGKSRAIEAERTFAPKKLAAHETSNNTTGLFGGKNLLSHRSLMHVSLRIGETFAGFLTTGVEIAPTYSHARNTQRNILCNLRNLRIIPLRKVLPIENTASSYSF
jgi:hypothetical protein